MKMAVEVFTTIIIVTVSCLLFVSIISMHIQATEAKNYHENIVNRIEDSDFNERVITECIDEADNKGYELLVEDKTVYEDDKSALISLKYQVTIPLFDLFGDSEIREGVIEGYAR